MISQQYELVSSYIRIGRNTVHATSAMIEELKWQSHRIDFEKLPVYNASLDSLDNQLIQNFLDNRKNQASVKVTQDVLRSYSLVVEEHSELFPTHVGLLSFERSLLRISLLFSDNPSSEGTRSFKLTSGRTDPCAYAISTVAFPKS
jgi:predicted HTH transcriptional regulator